MSEKLVDCHNCIGACCRTGTQLELSLEEASFMLRGGSRLKTLHQPVEEESTVEIEHVIGIRVIDGVPHAEVMTSPVRLTAGHGLYQLEGDCGYLEKDTELGPACTAYEDRPGICHAFEVGEAACRAMRKVRYETNNYPNWQPVELTTKA